MLYKKYILFLEAKMNEISIEREIDYENGIFFNYKILKGKFIPGYRFNGITDSKLVYNLYYIKDITPFQESHWNKHTDLLREYGININSEKEALEFTDFEHLYYLGMGTSSHVIKDHNLNPITSLVIGITLKIEDEFDKNVLIFSSSPFVRNLKINVSSDKKHTNYLIFDALIPQKKYEEIKNKSYEYIGTEEKEKIIEFIISSKKYNLLN